MKYFLTNRICLFILFQAIVFFTYGQCVTPPSYDFTISPTTSWQTTSSSVTTSGCKVYRIYMTTAYGYDFSMCSTDGYGGTTNSDGDFTMYNSTGVQLWYIDGTSGCGYDASTIGSAYQNWAPPSDGYYYIKIDEYDGLSMTFTLAYKYIATEMKVPSTGNNSYSTCSGNLYDNGGSTSNYSSSCNGYTVLNPSVAGNKVRISGTTSGEACCDYVRIYNGSGTAGTVLGTYYMGTAIPTLTSTDASGALTVLIYSDGSVEGSGVNISITCFTPCATVAGTASASPTSVNACSNTTLTLSGHSGSIQWQSSTDNIIWANISGATSTPQVTTVGGNTYYRAAVTSGCTSYSNSILVSVVGSGTKYYINNNSLSGDIWCNAIGNASNSGMSPCAPKASLQDIFDNYDIDPGDTIFVDAGTYTMGLDITSADEGSAGSKVVITGTGITTTIITAPANDDNFTLTSVQYTKLMKMKLISSQASNCNYSIFEGTHNIIDNCHLVHSANTNILYRSDGGTLDIDLNSISNCIIENSSASGYNIWFDGDADNDTIRNCTITSTGNAGAKAFYLTDRSVALSDMWPTSVRMYNNTINADDYGIFANTLLGFSMEAFDIHDNTFNIASKDKADGCAIRINDHGIASTNYSNIYRNRINGGKHGIYLTDGADYINFYNNYINNSDIGIFVNDDNSDENTLIHNSFYNSQQCAYFNGDSKAYWTCQNNIFYTTGNSSYECLYAGNSTSTFVLCDNNIYYAPNGANLAEYVGAKALYATLAAWQGINHHDGTGNGDLNSFYTNPNYQAPASGDLHITGNFKTGSSVSFVTNDIFLTARSHPTIGAWEEGSTLPIELVQFTAKCTPAGVELNWITAQEINNDYFTLEKSFDGNNFSPLVNITGAGNSSLQTNYYYLDENINFSIANYFFYRLKQNDYNGETTTSDAVSVNCLANNEIDNIFVINQPESDNIQISISGSKGKRYKLSFIDYIGRTIYNEEVILDNTELFVTLNKAGLSAGLYHIVIQSETDVISKQIVISRH